MFSASSVLTLQRAVHDVGTNISNAQTLGYKQVTPFLVPSSLGGGGVVGSAPSMGAPLIHGFTDLSTGTTVDTSHNPYSFFIMQPDAFVLVTLPDGSQGYVRTGLFTLDANGNWIHAPTGFPLADAQAIPPNTTNVTINNAGQVMIQQAGQQGVQNLFQITLYKFMNPRGLRLTGEGVYVPTDNSGDAISGTPGSTGFASVKQGMVEGSNVDLSASVIFLMTLQSVLQAATQMTSLDLRNALELSKTLSQM